LNTKKNWDEFQTDLVTFKIENKKQKIEGK